MYQTFGQLLLNVFGNFFIYKNKYYFFLLGGYISFHVIGLQVTRSMIHTIVTVVKFVDIIETFKVRYKVKYTFK